jgi:hypothetical protein
VESATDMCGNSNRKTMENLVICSSVVTDEKLTNITTTISLDENENIMERVSEEKIQVAIWELYLDKSHGPDGFTIYFYRVHWNTIKYDLVRMIQYIQKSFGLGGDTNSTFLTLIPKEENKVSFARFILIRLCNNSYKIITTIIASRIKVFLPKIISTNQDDFMEKR